MAVAEMCFHASSSVSALLRAFPWETTPLGPMDRWPSSWRCALSICLSSRYPLAVLLGPELTHLYNDAYIPIVGQKHPHFLAKPVRECWAEVWHITGPMMMGVMKTGEATWNDNLPMLINRNGYTEESYWTFSYSPIKEDTPEAAITGVYCTVAESTARYINERRMKLMQALSERTSSLLSAQLVCKEALSVLSDSPDVPFALLYQFDQNHLRCVGTAGSLNADKAPANIWLNPSPSCAADASLTDTVSAALQCSQSWLLTRNTFGLAVGDEAPEQTRGVAVIPLRSGALDQQQRDTKNTPFGVLIVGLNPRRVFDEAYGTFLRMIGVSFTSALVTARDHEKAMQRADTLAALDRAKNVFLSNISHEFRTPLTLLLGSLSEMQQTETGPKHGAKGELVSLAMRNARRLLRLVNALLDFSRIEAGRMSASYKPVQLLALTRDIVSVFRAACERGGISLFVNSGDAREWRPEDTVYVDIEMWEKIITNLVSNAYKYTMRGSITVTVTHAHDANPPRAVVCIQDTGCGIPTKELPRIFDRFYRADQQHQPARTHEGTGIGLALVSELVRLHGGTIEAQSQEGAGSVFTVRLPFGCAHLPAEHVSPDRTLLVTTDLAINNFSPSDVDVMEPAALPAPSTSNSRVLVVDDNADMLAYVVRILSPRYEVTKATNGRDALELLNTSEGKHIDLVVCDVMMPELDGFEMVRTMRNLPELRDTPVVMLSARADESARAEGLAAGADDYIVKPFSALQLVSSVEARIQLAQTRRSAATREKALYEEARKANMAKDRFLAALSHELRTPLAPALLTLESLLNDDRTLAVRADLELLMQSVNLENHIIGDLLDVTRIREGKLVLQRRITNMNEIIRQTARLLERDIVSKRITLKISTSAVESHAYIDTTRVQQILWNLIGNAIKFTPEKGTIAIESRNAPPPPDQPQHRGFIVVTVSDTGIGIESTTLPKIFTAFEQGDASVTREFGGLGLGLAIAHSLARMHDGSLTATSAGRGHGATFTLALPVALAAREFESPLSPKNSKRPRELEANKAPHRILLVDDNEPTLMVMSRMLGRLQYDVVAAKSVTGAVAILSDPAAKFDLLLTDLGLPDGSGYDILRHAQALGHTTRGLKALALSGYGTPEDIARSKQAGFDEHLTKPITSQALREALQRALGTMSHC